MHQQWLAPRVIISPISPQSGHSKQSWIVHSILSYILVVPLYLFQLLLTFKWTISCYIKKQFPNRVVFFGKTTIYPKIRSLLLPRTLTPETLGRTPPAPIHSVIMTDAVKWGFYSFSMNVRTCRRWFLLGLGGRQTFRGTEILLLSFRWGLWAKLEAWFHLSDLTWGGNPNYNGDWNWSGMAGERSRRCDHHQRRQVDFWQPRSCFDCELGRAPGGFVVWIMEEFWEALNLLKKQK